MAHIEEPNTEKGPTLVINLVVCIRGEGGGLVKLRDPVNPSAKPKDEP